MSELDRILRENMSHRELQTYPENTEVIKTEVKILMLTLQRQALMQTHSRDDAILKFTELVQAL